MSDEIKVKIVEEEAINVSITEETPIVISIEDGVPGWLSDIFEPEEGGHKITKMYIRADKKKLVIKYEGGE